MASIFGHLNLNDTDRVFQATVGQQVIFEAATEYVDRVNAGLNAAMAVFIERTTSDFRLRYKLPGGGTLSRRNNAGRYGAGKALGEWDVSLPLEDFGRDIAGDDVSMAYMTVAELERHIQNVTIQNVNTVRFEILRALFNNQQRVFVDPLRGNLLIEPLANGDAVLYPPVLGAVVEANENHYLESGYLSAAINDANNPYVTIRNELEEHFGAPTGGSNIAVFINPAESGPTENLTDYDPVPDNYIVPGQDTDVPTRIPAELLNIGKVIGRTNGVWVVEWRHIPVNYMLGIHLGEPKPLLRRIDPADTRLGDGLQLVAEEEEFPFRRSVWRHRFGVGCGNRLNGVVMELGVNGVYDIPAAFV